MDKDCKGWISARDSLNLVKLLPFLVIFCTMVLAQSQNVSNSTINQSVSASSSSINEISNGSPVLINYTYEVIPNNPTRIYISQANALIYVSAISQSYVKLEVINITNSSQQLPGYKPILVLYINVSSPVKSTSAMIMQYLCSIQASQIVAYEFTGKGWQKLNNFTTDPSSCTIKFGIPNYHVIGIFQSDAPQSQYGSNPYQSFSSAQSALAITGILGFAILLYLYKKT